MGGARRGPWLESGEMRRRLSRPRACPAFRSALGEGGICRRDRAHRRNGEKAARDPRRRRRRIDAVRSADRTAARREEESSWSIGLFVRPGQASRRGERRGARQIAMRGALRRDGRGDIEAGEDERENAAEKRARRRSGRTHSRMSPSSAAIHRALNLGSRPSVLPEDDGLGGDERCRWGSEAGLTPSLQDGQTPH
jgi:hypothetical protein